MGYLPRFVIMDAKRAPCHGSTGKLTNQYIIQDHMVSHYRKLYSAKAAVDSSVPKSMCCNVKYIDQKRREQFKKDMSERAQSARSVSQRSLRVNTRASSSLKKSRLSIQGNESAFLDLESSVMSSPRFNTSFNLKQVVYSSQAAGLSGNSLRSASECGYRSPDTRDQHSPRSCTASGGQIRYKTFQDPVQKTYCGDLLLKHAHRFTQEKPFTPRTLKSDHKSTLSQYRYYTPPKTKQIEDKLSSSLTHHEVHLGSSRVKGSPSARKISPQQAFGREHEWSDEESNAFGSYSKANRIRDGDLPLSSSRVSPEGMRSPIMKKVTEEEELKYLEFIADVTNEILMRGLHTDRVLRRVFERHIDMNKHRLDEDKMRHLLEVLQTDLQGPCSLSLQVKDSEKRDSFLPVGEEETYKTKDSFHLPAHRVFDKDGETFQKDTQPFVPTQVHFSLTENSASLGQAEDPEGLMLNQKESTTSIKDHFGLTDEENNQQDSADNHELIQQVDELGNRISESLTITEQPNSQEDDEQQAVVECSDDDF